MKKEVHFDMVIRKRPDSSGTLNVCCCPLTEGYTCCKGQLYGVDFNNQKLVQVEGPANSMTHNWMLVGEETVQSWKGLRFREYDPGRSN